MLFVLCYSVQIEALRSAYPPAKDPAKYPNESLFLNYFKYELTIVYRRISLCGKGVWFQAINKNRCKWMTHVSNPEGLRIKCLIREK
jgi:hypothetical protein